MRFRCAQCRALTQIQIPAQLAAPLVAACSGCGRKYRFAVDRPRGTDDQERYRKAKEYAEANGIDLGSAYSVLEGLMTLEEASTLTGGIRPERVPQGSPPQKESGPSSEGTSAEKNQIPSGVPPGPSPPSRASLQEVDVPFDPGFAPAVRDGCLSPQQAVERGSRRALALRLSQRHRLSMELALGVADNRMTVQKALSLKAALEAKEPPRPQTSVSHGVWNFMVYSIGTLILAALGVHIAHIWGEGKSPQDSTAIPPTSASVAAAPRMPPTESQADAVPAPPPPLTVPKTDTAGQLVEVAGPDPRSVLIAFCMSGRQSGRREPLVLAPTVPPDASARWGVFRNVDQPATPARAILIRKDRNSGRWVVGDGRSPILTEPPPAIDGQAVPVSAADPPSPSTAPAS